MNTFDDEDNDSNVYPTQDECGSDAQETVESEPDHSYVVLCDGRDGMPRLCVATLFPTLEEAKARASTANAKSNPRVCVVWHEQAD